MQLAFVSTPKQGKSHIDDKPHVLAVLLKFKLLTHWNNRSDDKNIIIRNESKAYPQISQSEHGVPSHRKAEKKKWGCCNKGTAR